MTAEAGSDFLRAVVVRADETAELRDPWVAAPAGRSGRLPVPQPPLDSVEGGLIEVVPRVIEGDVRTRATPGDRGREGRPHPPRPAGPGD